MTPWLSSDPKRSGTLKMGAFWGVDPFRITNKEGSILKKLSQKWVSAARPVFPGYSYYTFREQQNPSTL